jgi:hypothetical protein
VFTRARHWPLSSGTEIRPASPHPMYLSFVLILFSHVNLGLQIGFSFQDLGTKLCVHFLHLSLALYFALPVYPSCFDRPYNIVARMWRLYKTGIGLTTGFIGSHTVTHNYSVYTLQLTTAESILFL